MANINTRTETQTTPETKTLACGCVIGKYRCERWCDYHWQEDFAIALANERRRWPTKS